MKSIACCHVCEPLVMDCLIVIDTGLSSGNTCCGTGLLNFEISNTCPLILSPSLNVCNTTPPRDGRDSDGELLPLGIWKFIGATGGSGIVNVSVSVETVPPNANALPVISTLAPIVIPESSISVPKKLLFAPSVVAAPGVQYTF